MKLLLNNYKNFGCIINDVDRVHFYQHHFFNKKSWDNKIFLLKLNYLKEKEVISLSLDDNISFPEEKFSQKSKVSKQILLASKTLKKIYGI